MFLFIVYNKQTSKIANSMMIVVNNYGIGVNVGCGLCKYCMSAITGMAPTHC